MIQKQITNQARSIRRQTNVAADSNPESNLYYL